MAAGTVLTFNGTFYAADEAIGMWLNTPDEYPAGGVAGADR